ncbi:MAG TPA: glycosyltransferase family 4 protein [Sedimentisphaerales bacterium]|nr:glycosyltransferase family 4 protein [Sedimentisphaerales bacterium]HRS09726.1 glycosyltransferase family 4 protein [Sedimentisphaerales bacterium]HRV46624.1 glycosyltransferase family 4 protein [Sedimentisphaerales bacterium]
MRILLLNQFYKPDVAATGQLLADVGEALVARGHEVHVICSRRRYGGGSLTPAADEVLDGVHVHRVLTTGFGRRRLAGRAADYVSFYVSAAWRSLWLARPDVCLSLTTPPFIGLIGLMLGRLRGTRNVLWVMDLYPEIAAAYGLLRQRGRLCRLLGRINRRLYRNAEAVISLGEVMTQRLAAAGVEAGRLHTVHNWTPGEGVTVHDRPPAKRAEAVALGS